MQILFDEIPRLKGAIDGCQKSTNETRNNVLNFSDKAVKTIKGLVQLRLEDKNESGI